MEAFAPINFPLAAFARPETGVIWRPDHQSRWYSPATLRLIRANRVLKSAMQGYQAIRELRRIPAGKGQGIGGWFGDLGERVAVDMVEGLVLAADLQHGVLDI